MLKIYDRESSDRIGLSSAIIFCSLRFFSCIFLIASIAFVLVGAMITFDFT
jgi:hypothetical protein